MLEKVMEKVKKRFRLEDAAPAGTRAYGGEASGIERWGSDRPYYSAPHPQSPTPGVALDPYASLSRGGAPAGNSSPTYSTWGRTPPEEYGRGEGYRDPLGPYYTSDIEREEWSQGEHRISPVFKQVLAFPPAYYNYQNDFRSLGFVTTNRPPITTACAQGRVKVAGLAREITSMGEVDVGGRVHITDASAVTPLPSYPPQDLCPEALLKVMGVKISMGRSEANAPIPVISYVAAVPSEEAWRCAFSRPLASFIPFMATAPPREGIQNDTDKAFYSTMIDNIFNKTASAVSSALVGDQLMSVIQMNDLLTMSLYYKEEISRLRRFPEENEIISRSRTDADLLPDAQRKRLQYETERKQMLSVIASRQEEDERKHILEQRSGDTMSQSSPLQPGPLRQDQTYRPLGPPSRRPR
jgi:hypothetical protein